MASYILPAFSDTVALRSSCGSSSSGGSNAAAANHQQQQRDMLPPMSDPISVTRTFCGALLFPTVAAFLGSALFREVAPHSQFKRTLLGGITYVAVKGALKLYHKQHSYVRQCRRVIMDYDEPPPPPVVRTSSHRMDEAAAYPPPH